MPAPQRWKKDSSGRTGMDTSKYTKVQPPGHEHETKSPKSAKTTTNLVMTNGSVKKSKEGEVIPEDGTAERNKASAPEMVKKAQKPEVSSDTLCGDPAALSNGVERVDQDRETPRNYERESRTERRKRKHEKAANAMMQVPLNNGLEAVGQDRIAPKIGEKESRAQRHKRKLGGTSSIATQASLSNGVEAIDKNREAARDGKETRTKRKRKRGEREEGSVGKAQNNAKRPKSAHCEDAKPPSAGPKDPTTSPGPYSSHLVECGSRSGGAVAIKVKRKRKAHRGTAVVLNRKEPKRKRRTRRRRGDGKKVKGLSGLDTASKASGPMSLWKTSEAIGGRLIHADPVFSSDEKYLILALPSALRIYSSSTSLLVRSLPLESSSSRKTAIIGFNISPTSPNHIYVFTSRGRLEIWDWIEGTKIQRWEFQSEIRALAITSASLAENKSDIIFMVEKKYEKWRIKLFELVKDTKPSETDNQTKVVYECQQQILNLRVLYEGRVVVATSGKCLVVGTAKGEVTDGSYVWIEFTSSDWLTCLDVRESSEEPKSKREKSSKGGSLKWSPAIDVVVGDIKGAIFVHSDLLNRLIPSDQRDKSTRLEHVIRGASRRRHWHREAVHSVKWSLDGNYILSGGSETVLVLWQLDTDRQQYLPHLSATVESIVVSPKGSSYAIKLADNSMMTLSTTELKPKASIAGIQAKPWEPPRIPIEAQVKTVDLWEAQTLEKSSELPRVPSVINPLNPAQILLAVSSSQSNSFGPVLGLGSPYLQTFDFVEAHHISRQALARTNITLLNVGPEANKIGEPNIELLSISKNGKWLASVDEWNPPRRDLRFLLLGKGDVIQEQNRRREVYLKFWNWNDEDKIWELVTRVDAPHFSSRRDGSVGAGRVADIAADPSGLGFATVGLDGSVKLWRPKRRTRDGAVLKGRDSKELMSWVCHRTVQIGTQDRVVGLFGDQSASKDEHPAAPCLAYSADGSVVAASYPSSLSQGHSAVHLIDPTSGAIRYVRDGMQIGGILAIGMVGPYVILVGEALIVWDIVQDTLQYGVRLRLNGLSLKQKASMVHLAADQINNTFAISIPILKSTKEGESKQNSLERSHSEVVVFDPAVPKPLFSVSLPNVVTALLPTTGSKGYVVLDLAAELRVIADGGNNGFACDLATTDQELLLGEPQEAATEDAAGGHMMDIDEYLDEEHPTSWLPLQTATSAHDDDDSPPVVGQQQLAEIFDVGPSYAPPPVSELFERVVGLFARKPVPRI
ncbi:hypothetical protein FGG08_002658 [Glutinoglossum americanum]|uniref:WD40 repeat-like protein n=1 Tax=Glutinoglossum americanum TaxID=1670608 RepID=A0A9P8HZR3_9PEZI|nr:hypothetical protein FGG08_002658 [Glutinoglossum americanum]